MVARFSVVICLLGVAVLAAAGTPVSQETIAARNDVLANLFNALETGQPLKLFFAAGSSYVHEGGNMVPGIKSFTSDDPLTDHLKFQEQYWKINFFENLDFAVTPDGIGLVTFHLNWNFIATGKQVDEICFLRYTFNDQNLITENFESCNSLAEYLATIPNSKHCHKTVAVPTAPPCSTCCTDS